MYWTKRPTWKILNHVDSVYGIKNRNPSNKELTNAGICGVHMLSKNRNEWFDIKVFRIRHSFLDEAIQQLCASFHVRVVICTCLVHKIEKVFILHCWKYYEAIVLIYIKSIIITTNPTQRIENIIEMDQNFILCHLRDIIHRFTRIISNLKQDFNTFFLTIYQRIWKISSVLQDYYCKIMQGISNKDIVTLESMSCIHCRIGSISALI